MVTFTWKLELKLDGVNWTDCTADVSLEDGNIEIVNGFQSTSLVDRLANPGSISWVFDNSAANSAHLAGYYSPGHANCRSGFAKNIQVRYRYIETYTDYYQGTYWLEKITPSPGVFGEATTRCRATDWLGVMMSEALPLLAVQWSHRADQLLTTLLAAVPTQPAACDFDTGDSTFYTAFDCDDVDKDTVYSVLGKVARSEYGRIYLQPDQFYGGGVLTFERRGARPANTTELGTLWNEMDDIEIIDNAGEVYDRFHVQIKLRRSSDEYINLARLNTYMYLAPGEERTFTLKYTDPNGGNRLNGQNYGGINFLFGTVGNGVSDNLHTYLYIVMLNFGSNSALIYIRNNYSGGGYINKFDLLGNAIYTDQTYTAEAGTGGLRVLTLEMPYESNPAIANTLATTLQAIASNNTRRSCRVRFHANKSANLMQAALFGRISTRWYINETQTALNNQIFLIDGSKHTVSLGNRLDVEWLCEPEGAY